MRKILIVDDESVSRMSLRDAVEWELHGYTIAGFATNGRRALEQARALRPDVVITDIKMPVMDGLALIKALKEEGNGAKVVILSCYEDFDYAREALRLGAVDYLLKHTYEEADIVALLHKLDALFQDHSTGEESRERLREEVLRGLATGRLADGEIRRYAATGVLERAEGPIVPLVLRIQGGEAEAGLLLEACCREGEAPARWFREGEGRYGVVVLLPAGTSSPDAEERARDFLGGLAARLAEAGMDLGFGAGRPVADWAGLPGAYREAAATAAGEPDYSACSAKVRAALEYIRVNYARPISLDDIAREAGISRIYLSQVFHKETGVKLSDYLIRYRLDKAKALLSGSNLKIYAVAEMTGFGSAQYFSQIFKRYTGLNPADYKERAGG